MRSALSRAFGLDLIRLHHKDLPACELERPRVDACKGEFQYAAGAVPQQLEDVRCRTGGKSRRQPSHGETLTLVLRGASRRG